MKKLRILLAGFGLGLILLSPGIENSLAEEKSLVLHRNTLLGTSEVSSLTYLSQQDMDTIKIKSNRVSIKEKGLSVKKGKKLCLRGKPLPECSSFLLTEFGYAYRFDQQSNDEHYHYLSWELGYMLNRTENSALGATFLLSLDEDYDEPRLGLKPRYRRWLNRNMSIDIALGILLYGWQKRFKFPSFSGHIGWNIVDWFSLTGQIEIIRWRKFVYSSTLEKTDTDVAWYAGFKLGTPLGAAGGTVAAAIIAFIVLSDEIMEGLWWK